LIIAGRGSLAAEIQRIARPPIEFLGEVSDTRLRELYRRCRALVFAGLEDFGMVLAEAQAAGRPVVCFGDGGAREAVLPGQTGVYFHEQSEAAILHAVAQAETTEWVPDEIRAHSLQFSRRRFADAINAILQSRAGVRPALDDSTPLACSKATS
jgi:glycosyltransferase involved in cell wall biosynthesis